MLASEARRSASIDGMAMLTMVTSSNPMNMPIETATRIHHLRGWPSSGESGPGVGMGAVKGMSFRGVAERCRRSRSGRRRSLFNVR